MPVLPEPSEQSAGSPLYTYAFLPMPDAPLWHFIQQTQGIRGPLQVFSPPGGRIAAAVEPMPDPASLQASDEVLVRSALRHDQVICRLFAQMPLLPLRFGTCFLSAEKLGSHLLAQQAEYEQALAAIGGRAEYCLKGKLSPQPSPDPQPAPSGTAYLLARKQAYLLQRQAQERQEQELAALQQLWPSTWPVQRGDPQPGEVLRLYFLLTPAEREAAAQLTQTWVAAHPRWQLDWSPPLPPYHFMGTLRDPSRCTQ
ncbi:GvpL/GvpF family gas vesicle protein [Synechococcus sp. H60.2]|uniref:GvpL/GvpF family gas vesicle protein n=1 Tax=unclassified Synechococcus TaxID=2626047 RepID=UPI0039C0D72E